jgi:hypothetical protein
MPRSNTRIKHSLMVAAKSAQVRRFTRAILLVKAPLDGGEPVAQSGFHAKQKLPEKCKRAILCRAGQRENSRFAQSGGDCIL